MYSLLNNLTITQQEQDRLTDELPAYAEMLEFLKEVYAKTSPSRMYLVTNIFSVLEQSAKLITSEDQDKRDAETKLNEMLR